MGWDFSTEPEFQRKLDWVEDFCKKEVEPLDLIFPYAKISRSKKMKWYTLRTPSIEVPEVFTVALAFNPHRTKGIYVGLDESVRDQMALERELQQQLFQSQDAREGIAAYVERRKPKFRGK